MASKPKDISGNRYGRLVAQHRLGKCSNGDYLWHCQCDCGNTTEVSIGRLNFGTTNSCGCLAKEVQHKTHYKHGSKSNPEYKSWCKIKERVFNPNCPDYKDYGAVGIGMQEDWVRDFAAFLDHIGPKPQDGRKYSVNRIDNDLGYIEGNVKWSLDTEQSRNRGKHSSNTSGVTGVRWDNKKYATGACLYAVAQWNDLNGNFCKKNFSVKKLGLLEAFALAVDYRRKMIAELNAQGAGYSDKHGL